MRPMEAMSYPIYLPEENMIVLRTDSPYSSISDTTLGSPEELRERGRDDILEAARGYEFQSFDRGALKAEVAEMDKAQLSVRMKADKRKEAVGIYLARSRALAREAKAAASNLADN